MLILTRSNSADLNMKTVLRSADARGPRLLSQLNESYRRAPLLLRDQQKAHMMAHRYGVRSCKSGSLCVKVSANDALRLAWQGVINLRIGVPYKDVIGKCGEWWGDVRAGQFGGLLDRAGRNALKFGGFLGKCFQFDYRMGVNS